ncbi:hypothetical protein T492DRAFT_1050551 [Pavlovales sp. CCMP2436]|nr:hypothetical protein T492DRAFT_1050551 [Pavlovales sp. CCMP2436]
MPLHDTHSAVGAVSMCPGWTPGSGSPSLPRLSTPTPFPPSLLSPNSKDLAFTKAARALTTSGDTSWGGKRISFDQFVYALQLCAESAGCEPDVLYAKCLAVSAPSVKATIADNVKFHDDKSTFTAVARNGGPSKIDGQAWSKGLN